MKRVGFVVAAVASACMLVLGLPSRPPEAAADDGPHPELVEVRPSHIPGAGDGLFAKVFIPEGTYIGFYEGDYVTEAEADAIEGKPSDYLFFIPDCANDPYYESIAGDVDHYVSKVNFGPLEINGKPTNLQNVDFDLHCEEPYARLVATRDIKAGEELLSDYGPSYPYGFMDLPAVQDYLLGAATIEPAEEFTWDYAETGE
jgi:hypothetical protein